MKIKNIKAFLLGGIVFSVLTGVALMSYTSAAGNEIQGCVGQNGALRIIGAGSSKEKCKKSETPISWNVQGSQGIKGESGIPGTPGMDGEDGVDGKNGIDGKDGVDGVSIPCMRIEGNNVIFEGCNIHVRSGSGQTDGTVNGLGNIIIGYDENGGSDIKTGSHNLVVGDKHTYTSFSGVISGKDNEISNKYSVSIGCEHSISSGDFSAVIGGAGGTVHGDYSSVVGGNGNAIDTAAIYSAIFGGQSNFIGNGDYATIGGGEDNAATGDFSAVSGGKDRMATGTHDWKGGSLFEDN